MGSGTLLRWIEQMMAEDAATTAAAPAPAPAAAALPIVAPKSSWPELVGMPGRTAVAAIQRERPDLAEVSTLPEDSMVTMDWREDRVRVFVDGAGTVVHPPPTCG
jgi:hypothetical protein